MFAVRWVEMCWFVLSNHPPNKHCMSVWYKCLDDSVFVCVCVLLVCWNSVNCHLRKQKVADGAVVDRKTDARRQMMLCGFVFCQLQWRLCVLQQQYFIYWFFLVYWHQKCSLVPELESTYLAFSASCVWALFYEVFKAKVVYIDDVPLPGLLRCRRKFRQMSLVFWPDVRYLPLTLCWHSKLWWMYEDYG